MEEVKKKTLASKVEVIVHKTDKSENALMLEKWTQRSDAEDSPKFAQTLRDNVLRRMTE